MASEKEQIWLTEYLRTFNATEAARRAGYAWPNVQGQQKKEKFRNEIKRVLSERTMTPEEIIDELQQIAQGDLGDIMDITSMGFTVDMKTAKEKGLTKLIRKVKQKTTLYQSKSELIPDSETHEIEVELYSRHEALRDLGKIHALFTDKIKIEGWRGEVVALLRTGAISPQDVMNEIDDDELAVELFREAGVSVE